MERGFFDVTEIISGVMSLYFWIKWVIESTKKNYLSIRFSFFGLKNINFVLLHSAHIDATVERYCLTGNSSSENCFCIQAAVCLHTQQAFITEDIGVKCIAVVCSRAKQLDVCVLMRTCAAQCHCRFRINSPSTSRRTCWFKCVSTLRANTVGWWDFATRSV